VEQKHLPVRWLISRQPVIILIVNLEETTMAQRRAEKPKKKKISPKQQEFYSRVKSGKK